ncbi:TlpA disulfide reductase family protein [Cellulophaga sp. L1A9]|uniref:TlpA family protein disulfide reductase n=1 Tax=Cellulophaga sp. L1A9 TaxID=2686362 RepID=UPI00131B0665|nr:TlpA disulfide reductase family protein [Cellulophaga sp. L1A9]
MRRHLGITILLLACSISCNQIEKKPIDSVNEINVVTTASSLFVDLEGNPISLNDYKGKKILLNFWATWCRPCIEEMPSLERAMALLKEDNYVFLLATDESVETINNFKVQTNVKLNFIRYTGTLSQLKIYALPATFIYNEQGKEVTVIRGAAEWDSSEMIKKLKNFN